MRTETWLNDYVFTVKDFFSKEECDEYITMGEDIGFEEALVNSVSGTVRMASVRNNDRVMFKSQDIAERLWERAEDYVPCEIEGRRPVGINELIRFYRYDVDQQFNWHQDFPFERENGEKSFYTMLVYLNDDFEGGETSFEDSCSEESFDEHSVVPEVGLAVFFEHQTHHKGETVLEGRKYVLRSDVMYASTESDDDYWNEIGDEDEY